MKRGTILHGLYGEFERLGVIGVNIHYGHFGYSVLTTLLSYSNIHCETGVIHELSVKVKTGGNKSD